MEKWVQLNKLKIGRLIFVMIQIMEKLLKLNKLNVRINVVEK